MQPSLLDDRLLALLRTLSQLAVRAATLVEDMFRSAPALADAGRDYPPARLLSLFSAQDPYRG